MHQTSETIEDEPAAPSEPAPTARWTRRRLWSLVMLYGVAFGCVGFATWYSMVPLTASAPIGRVFAPGVEGNAIYHPAGGTVARVLVREGQKVKAGEILMLLDAGAVTAPSDGAVFGLNVYSPGDVVRPGEKILAIVPMAVLALES